MISIHHTSYHEVLNYYTFQPMNIINIAYYVKDYDKFK